MNDRRRGIPSHWTPRYVVDRARLELEQRRAPDRPWLTAAAVEFLDAWVRHGDQCLEWGSGRSTWWLAARGVDVRTVEHDADWASQVRSRAHGPGRIDLELVGADQVDRYVGAHPDMDAADLAIVDGIHRAQCAVRAVELLRPGGLLVVDNVERYLPSTSRSPEAIGAAPAEPDWQAFADATTGWRRYWTSNGVTDTAFWFSPAAAG